MFGSAPIPPKPWNCRKVGCNRSDNTLLHGAETVYPPKNSSSSNDGKQNAGASQSKPSSGEPSIKITPIPSVGNVKSLQTVLLMFGSAPIPGILGKLLATAHITHFFMELRHLIRQKTLHPAMMVDIRLVQVKVNLIVGNHQVRSVQYHLSVM